MPAERTSQPAWLGAIHPPRLAIIKAPGWLPMQYKPAQLVEELGLTPPTIRDWLKRSVPRQRDAHDQIWIKGQSLTAWLNQAVRSCKAGPLAEDRPTTRSVAVPSRLRTTLVVYTASELVLFVRGQTKGQIATALHILADEVAR